MSDPRCPGCGHPLAKMPTRKVKCPSCGDPIFVKSTPENRTKRLMTNAQAQAAEAMWNEKYAASRPDPLNFDPAATMQFLRDAARGELERIARTAKLVEGIKVQIRPGAGARLHEVCRNMGTEPLVTAEEELRNPRLPNPACPMAMGSLKSGFCNCYYAAWKADWKIDRPKRW